MSLLQDGPAMKTTLIGLVSAVFLLSGCAVAFGPPRPGTSRSSLSSGGTPQCHPSQYWDGAMCRHKGKGSGARKHDG